MKKKLVLLAVICICISAKAQLIAEMELLIPHYYPGEVYFKDGHHEEYVEVELPRVGKSKLSVKKYDSDKKRTTIEAEDIICIKIWHKDFPDKVHVLYYVHAKKYLLNNEHQWGTPIMGNSWGVVYQCEMNYKMNNKTGELGFVKFVGGKSPDTPTLYYLMRPVWQEAQLVMWDEILIPKKKAAEIFAENEEISQAILDGKLSGEDMEYILDEMAGGQKEKSLDTKPASESEQNGEIGDDE